MAVLGFCRYRFRFTDTNPLAQTQNQIYGYKSVWLRHGSRFTDTNPYGSDTDSELQTQICLAQTRIQIYRYKSLCIYLWILFYKTQVKWHFTSHLCPAFVDFVLNSSISIHTNRWKFTNIFPLKNTKLMNKWWYTSCKLVAQIQIELYRYKSHRIYLWIILKLFQLLKFHM